MASVPISQGPRVQQAGIPGVRVNNDAPIESFGGGSGNAEVFKSIGNVGLEASKVYEEEKKKADMTAADAAVNDLLRKKNELQYDPKIGAMSKQGKDAFGIVPEYTKHYDDLAEQISGTLSNSSQQAMFAKAAAGHKTSFMADLERHTFDQTKKYQEETAKSGVEAREQDAVMNYHDTAAIQRNLGDQASIIGDLGRSQGKSPEQIQQEVANAQSKTQTAIISQMISNGQARDAEKYFNENKASFGMMQAPVQAKINDEIVVYKANDVWEKVKNLRLSDGAPDERRMEAAVMGDQSLTEEQRQRVDKIIKTKASEQVSNKAREDKALDESFRNNAIDMRKQGMPLEQALSLPGKYGIDSYDKALKEEFILKLYSNTEQKTVPAVKVALEDAIDEGNVTRDQIDKAYYQDKTISSADWMAMRARHHNIAIEGKSPTMQRANEQVKEIAKARFGSDSDGMAKFISEVRSDGMNKTPEQMVKIATDKLKEDESTATRFWNWVPLVGGSTIPGFSGQPQYQTDEEKRSANSLMTGKFQQDLGPETVKAIEMGAVRSGSKTPDGQPMSGPAAVDAISISVGGYENMKPGTPVHNAMQSLSRAGKVVTPESIKAVLRNYPDGNFQAPTAPLSVGNKYGVIKVPAKGKR